MRRSANNRQVRSGQEEAAVPAPQAHAKSTSAAVASGLAVVVPYYAGHEDFGALLESLEASSLLPESLIIVDNGPRDQRFTDLVRVPATRNIPITVIDAPVGLGFGRACNAGVHVAAQQSMQDVMLLNQDAWLHPQMLEELLNARVQQRADLVGPSQFSPRSMELSQLFAALYFPTALDGDGRLLRAPDRPAAPRAVDELAGACILMAVNVATELGPFDPIYTMYGEDVDLGRRARAAGLRAFHVPSAVLYHHHTNETGRSDPDTRRRLRAWSEESRAINILRRPAPLHRVVFRLAAARLRAYAAGVVREGPGVFSYLVASDRRLVEKAPLLLSARRGRSAGERARHQVSADLALASLLEVGQGTCS